MVCRCLSAGVVVVCLILSACSGPGASDGHATEPSGGGERAAKPVTRTIQGFRIQIASSTDKAAADRTLAQAYAWWTDLPTGRRPSYLGGDELSVDVRWMQPFYRVRMGDFATHAQAERALPLVEDRFPNAIIVPDTVTITR